LRGEQKIVEGAAANEVEQVHTGNVPPYGAGFWVLGSRLGSGVLGSKNRFCGLGSGF